MQCRRCGKELGNSGRCSFCGYDNLEGNVREMTSMEKNCYDGLTIDTGETADQNSNESNSYRRKTNQSAYQNFSRRTIYTSSSNGIFARLIDKFLFGLMNNKLVAKIALTLIGVALAALMFFVALPILFFMLAIGIALFVLSKLGR